MPYSEYLAMALYDPGDGFFSTGRGAGRGGDFLTSPEVGPLFGQVLAGVIDRWWAEGGRPDPWFVVEAGAGAGSLAAAILATRPDCSPALRYVLVERSAVLRSRQADRLPLEPPSAVSGPMTFSDPDQEDRVPVGGSGPVVTSLADLPAQRLTGVVLANELLDNLPVDLLERRGGAWLEIRVGVGEGQSGLTEVLVPAPPDKAASADRLAPSAPEGGRIPLQRGACSWLTRALSLLETGRLIVIDYADTTPSLARRPWTAWLRTYRAHRRGGHPLQDAGGQDVTCEVAVDQLALVRKPSSDRSQAEFLRSHGLDELAQAARAGWRGRAAIGDLEALAALSRAGEAVALTDPTGLGAHRVLEWEVP
jgi:SAM-dependent MidA family methyltransferase